jgi:hypothetical protein
VRRVLALLIGLCTAPVAAQTVVTSPGPDTTSVTVYRDPDRGEGGIDASFPTGFALIFEKRRIALPAGDAVIRFEGVADGMIAVSAVVTGLPGKVVQKNRDAKLLSPAALLDGSLGNRVHLRCTDRATGKVMEQDVVVQSSADNALVIQTAEGFEGLQCSGLPETIRYEGVPEGLSAKPTLSVTTQSPAATSAEVTLTYLATGFDWGANYVAKMGEDGRTLDLFAWLTVANGNDVSFPGTDLLAVAGKLDRESDYDALVTRPDSPSLNLECWPLPNYDAPPPSPPPSAPMMDGTMDIVVTARRNESLMASPVAVMAAQEELGDLKLYRVPVRVDVNASGQKQVALLEKRGVPFRLYYTADLRNVVPDDESHAMQRMLRMVNRKADGLGLPLPSGGVALFQQAGEQSLLLADADLRDHAVGETVELQGGDSAQQRYMLRRLADRKDRVSWLLELTNASDRAVQAEIMLPSRQPPSARTGKVKRTDGAWVWIVDLPANGAVRMELADRADDR